MDLTVTLDDQILRQAQKTAATLGKTVPQLVLEYLQKLATQDEVRRDLETFDRLSSPPRGDSAGWRFNREEIYERS